MKISKLRPITEAEVRRFLINKGTTDKCFSCGHDGWFMDGGAHDLYRCLPWGRPMEGPAVSLVRPIESAISVVTMTCQNCGLVRMHDVYAILAWLAHHPEEAV